MLAGISADYYLRLEQGRDRSPSAPIIDALARVLQLDEPAAAHLRALSRVPVGNRAAKPQQVLPSIKRMIESWPLTPAFVYGRRLDILTVNPLAAALLPFLAPGINLVRVLFLDPEVRKYIPDWEGVTDRAVARLHALAVPETRDPCLEELVRELSGCSDRFQRLWSRHDVEVAASPKRLFTHPLVGSLELQGETLEVSSTPGQFLGIFHAEPGTRSARALSHLSRLIAVRPARKR